MCCPTINYFAQRLSPQTNDRNKREIDMSQAKYDQHTEANIATLQTDFADRVRQWLEEARKQGLNPYIHFGARSVATQEELHKKFLAGGPKAVAPEHSYHCYGRAFDWVHIIDPDVVAKKRYDQFDKSGTKDPNLCKALLQFPDHGAVFWSSKMAIDADGPPAGPGRPNGKQLDPGSGQNGTSFQLPGGGSLPSET